MKNNHWKILIAWTGLTYLSTVSTGMCIRLGSLTLTHTIHQAQRGRCVRVEIHLCMHIPRQTCKPSHRKECRRRRTDGVEKKHETELELVRPTQLAFPSAQLPVYLFCFSFFFFFCFVRKGGWKNLQVKIQLPMRRRKVKRTFANQISTVFVSWWGTRLSSWTDYIGDEETRKKNKFVCQ